MPKKKQLKSVEEYVLNAIENIHLDRASATLLLNQLSTDLLNDSSKHEKSGLVAAKYLETLQRSNEQFVKVIELLRKKKDQNESFGKDDIENIYDELQED